ncbi:MAG TPA: hypothetical protein VK154_12895 [Chitinophagales bacterium]|nr:hypothetical protein [Chitinophagales bacterium]
MKVSGFTIVRNALKYDYPVVEAILSILPLCDEFIVSVGNSEDDTLALIQSINSPKIKIVQTVWDDNLRQGGKVLAIETDKAFAHIAPDTDWAFYIQADEVVHEKYHDNIRAAMLQHKDNKAVDGLLFNYLHFYGAYNYTADAYNWYRKEIRIVRKRTNIYSHGDAQGFRKGAGEKLNVKQIDAFVYHYGWVKDPQAQQRKQENFHKLWHDDTWVEQNVVKATEYDYGIIDSLKKFEGTHPAIIQPRIAKQNWTFDFDTTKSKMKLKYRLRRWIENTFGISVGEYRNYKLIE